MPVITSFLEPDGFDASGGETVDTGLGNVRLLVRNGHTWREGAENLLFELEVGLPTDRRDDIFAIAGDASMAVIGEHYWDWYGIIGVVAGDYFAESGFAGGEWSLGYLAGVGLDLSQRWFVSALAGRADGSPRIEVEGEFFSSSSVSVKIFAGLDVDGESDARFMGVLLTCLFGGSETSARASETSPSPYFSLAR